VAVPGTGGLGFLQAQALEASNVDVATELVNLLIAQRSFSFNATAITVENQMLADAAALIS
jgi:flagellar hook protein FlgE